MFSHWFRRKEAAGQAQGEPRPEDPRWEEVDDEDEEDEDEKLEAIHRRVSTWGEEWSRTPAFAALTEAQKEECEFIVETFTEYMYRYQGSAPEEWDVHDMEECCVHILPRKVSAGEAYFGSLAPVLASFFMFLGETGRLRRASRLVAHIRAIDRKIVDASADPRNWGMAKSFAMSAQAAGVDMSDEAEMNRFMLRYNMQQMARVHALQDSATPQVPSLPADFPPEVETYVRPGPKVGRNDPCPCGSGKKYKKCCGGS